MKKLFYLIVLISLILNCGTASARETKKILINIPFKKYELFIHLKEKFIINYLIGDFPIKIRKKHGYHV
jgi:hypothetical protein